MRLLALGLLGAAAALPWRPGAARPALIGRASLTDSAATFTGCQIKDGDVDLDVFVKATREFCELIRKWGSFTSPSISQVYLCISKMEKARDELQRSGDKQANRDAIRRLQRRCKTMKELLEAEAAAKKHKPGGVLADPSGAMGLLWVRRGLAYWEAVFELEAKRLQSSLKSSSAGGLSFKQQCQRAYEKVLQPFHGWVSKRGFAVALHSMPDWKEARSRSGLTAEDKKFLKELQEWTLSVRALLKKMTALHVKYDMEDRRRSI